ncbi:MAG: inositol monophosphatase family protein [Mariniblastus sp.]|nr:inositol monophosphatase family protein [Mariniblastus sp.]
MAPPLIEFSQACTSAANLGGQVLMKWLGKTTPKEKGFRDLVTQADLESQQVIRDFLLKEFPDHRFIGEEDSHEETESLTDEDFCWIADPLDGTTNYVHQLRSFAVSIALQRGNETLVGSVLDPVLQENYSAIKNHGAMLNGEPIHTSGCDKLSKALFVFSFGRGIDRNDVQVTRFLNTLESAGSIRRLGSAALNLCYLACGRVDGYWATELKKWDVAAGWLIATEAGATIKDFRGKPIDLDSPYFCATSTERLYEQIQPLLNI